MKQKMLNALFLCKLALSYQRCLDLPPHRIDPVLRRRAWEWWSEAIAEGIVLG